MLPCVSELEYTYHDVNSFEIFVLSFWQLEFKGFKILSFGKLTVEDKLTPDEYLEFPRFCHLWHSMCLILKAGAGNIRNYHFVVDHADILRTRQMWRRGAAHRSKVRQVVRQPSKSGPALNLPPICCFAEPPEEINFDQVTFREFTVNVCFEGNEGMKWIR